MLCGSHRNAGVKGINWGEPERAPHKRFRCARILYVCYIVIYIIYIYIYSGIYVRTSPARLRMHSAHGARYIPTPTSRPHERTSACRCCKHEDLGGRTK